MRKRLGIGSIGRLKKRLGLGYKAVGMEICWNGLTVCLTLAAECLKSPTNF